MIPGRYMEPMNMVPDQLLTPGWQNDQLLWIRTWPGWHQDDTIPGSGRNRMVPSGGETKNSLDFIKCNSHFAVWKPGGYTLAYGRWLFRLDHLKNRVDVIDQGWRFNWLGILMVQYSDFKLYKVKSWSEIHLAFYNLLIDWFNENLFIVVWYDDPCLSISSIWSFW